MTSLKRCSSKSLPFHSVPGFLNSTITFGPDDSYLGAVHCRLLNSIPGLCPPGASSTRHPPGDQKLFPDTALGVKSPWLRIPILHQPALRQEAPWVHCPVPGTVPCSLMIGGHLCAARIPRAAACGLVMDTSTSVSSVCGICALFLSSGLPFSIMCPDFSKCTSLRIGLYAVKIRAEAMQEASEAVPSGMLSVLGQRQSNFTVACLEAQEHCKTRGIENPVCEVSNYLFPDCRVISGHLEVGVGGSILPRTQSSAEGGTDCTPGSPPSLTGALLSPGLGKCLRASVSVVG